MAELFNCHTAVIFLLCFASQAEDDCRKELSIRCYGWIAKGALHLKIFFKLHSKPENYFISMNAQYDIFLLASVLLG